MPPFSLGSGGLAVQVVAAPSVCRGTGSVLGGGRQEAGEETLARYRSRTHMHLQPQRGAGVLGSGHPYLPEG